MSRALVCRELVGCLVVVAGLSSVPLGVAGNQSSRLSPQQLVREAVQNEITSSRSAPTHFMFKDVRKTVHLSQTKLLVETRDATAGMIIAQNGQPLNEQQRKAEESRLENYVRNPDELNRKRKQEKEDADRTERIMRALPEAFIYEQDGTQAGSANVGHSGHELMRLNFRPNPSYNPPSRVEQVLTAMAGHLLIDPREKRIAEIDGILQRDVGFGWGILGHLDKGGHFLVQQAEVVDQTWDVTRMQLSFTGKVLLVKKLNIQSTDIFSDYHLVPTDLTFAQGVELLKKKAAQEDAASEKVGGVESKTKAQADSAVKSEDSHQLCCDR